MIKMFCLWNAKRLDQKAMDHFSRKEVAAFRVNAIRADKWLRRAGESC